MMSCTNRRRLEALVRRKDFLDARIADDKAEGLPPNHYDRHERDALKWAIAVIEVTQQ